MFTKFLLVALVAGVAHSSPVRLARRSIWTNVSCTGNIEGDSNLAVSIPTGIPIFYLESPLKSEVIYENKDSVSLAHETLCTSQNDTSVIVAASSSLSMSYVDIVKFGYSSDLNQASFFGVNAAVNIQNGSTLTADHVNITAHNGAAGIYSYGTGTTVNVTASSYYATGPTSHGLYASGSGTIYAQGFHCVTLGYRSSCLSGDNPAGYLHVEDAWIQMWGYGSAVAYTLGTTNLVNVNGYSYQGPGLIQDGNQTLVVSGSDIEGGFFAGVVLFSSQPSFRIGYANFTDTVIRTHGDDIAAFAVANEYGVIHADSLTTVTESGILLCANYSGIAQDFDKWYSSTESAAASSPGYATMYVTNSHLYGDIRAINGSTIDWHLGSYSVWEGTSQPWNESRIGVYLDETSAWKLTADAYLRNFTISGNSLANIDSSGFNLYYDQAASANSWINNATVSLTGGGSLIPY